MAIISVQRRIFDLSRFIRDFVLYTEQNIWNFMSWHRCVLSVKLNFTMCKETMDKTVSTFDNDKPFVIARIFYSVCKWLALSRIIETLISPVLVYLSCLQTLRYDRKEPVLVLSIHIYEGARKNSRILNCGCRIACSDLVAWALIFWRTLLRASRDWTGCFYRTNFALDWRGYFRTRADCGVWARLIHWKREVGGNFGAGGPKNVQLMCLVEEAPDEIGEDSVNRDQINWSENGLQIFEAAILFSLLTLSVNVLSNSSTHIWLNIWSFIF